MDSFSIFKESNFFFFKNRQLECVPYGKSFQGLMTVISGRPPSTGVVEGMDKTTGEKDLKEKSAAHDEGYASHDDDDDARKDKYRQPSKKKHKHGNGEKRKYDDDDEDEEKASPLN
jgi:hypothetical protein